MTTLTAEQIADFRMLVGDECTPDYLSDPQIDALYVKAAGKGLGEDETEALTVVYMIRRLLGKASAKVDVGSDIQRESRSQWFDHLKDLLEMYEKRAGLGGVKPVLGAIGLGIDATEDDET